MVPSVLVASFEDLPDPRVERTRVHRLGDILVIAVLAVLAGADGWDDMVEWAEARKRWLRTFVVLRAGIPSADTVRRLFEAIDPKKFAACFERMVAHLSTHMPDQLLVLDGKTMRRTFSRSAGEGPLHVVSAWAVEQGVVLGQVATDAKSNEITAIPELLDLIDVKKVTVSIDAIGCQREIAAKIVGGGGDYLLSLKGNQPLLHQEVVEYFEHARQDRTLDARPPAVHQTSDKGHGRLEVRRTFCTDDIDWMTERPRWKGLRSLVMVERERTVGGETSVEKAYYLTTHRPDPARLGEMVRRHWSIENELHWVLDMTFDEDHSRIRDRTSAMNLALLRKLSLSLLKREQSDPRKSVAMKRRRVGWDNDYLFTVLAAAAPSRPH
jgi:predicted transposase YbfD/YdcC